MTLTVITYLKFCLKMKTMIKLFCHQTVILQRQWTMQDYPIGSWLSTIYNEYGTIGFEVAFRLFSSRR
ncbi:hypothetical protein LWI28_007123 [Acer negundo]|uniref:Uncharacterized protein n=1 Tax=Acer negundo TaxID=4023 RepID=A0AAD5JPJ5_ACENE|nr:hypothetical protein LWI28_007123 [Acer negundo]